MSETLEIEEVVTTAGPGQRLAEAREAQGLALEDVASQLRLSLHILQALERDDYDQLPPAAFVTGYLRSYARLLGLPEQEILDSFTGAAKVPTVGAVARSQPPQVRASDPPVRLVTYLVFGGLILLSIFWWISQGGSEEPAAESVMAATEPASEPEAEPARALAEEIVPPAEPSAPERSEEPAPVAVTTPPPPAASATPAAAEPAQPAQATAAPAVPQPPPLTTDMPQSKLEITFTSDCWTEVTDAAGRVLAYDLYRGGRTLTLRGEAPFRVFFGYSPAAQVSLNDQPFDHSPYQRRNDTALFRVGSAQDNAARTD